MNNLSLGCPGNPYDESSKHPSHLEYQDGYDKCQHGCSIREQHTRVEHPKRIYVKWLRRALYRESANTFQKGIATLLDIDKSIRMRLSRAL